MMKAHNHTVFYPVIYILISIPGTEESHFWIAIPFCLIYVVSLFGNSLLLFIILTEQSLHEPMYLFVSMLAAADLLLSTTTVSKMLAVFWFRAEEISFAACLTQMFFIHVSFIAELAILLAMAFDRYVAICNLLRYISLLTKSVIGKMGLVVDTSSFCIILPLIVLMKQLNFCPTNLLPHTYCEHMIVARLACDDITVHVWYGVAVAILVIGSDIVLIAVSYGLILRAVFLLPSKEARLKALRTCGPHVCVILMFYVPAVFSSLAHQIGNIIPGYIVNLLDNLYVLIPPMLNPIVYGVTTKEILKRVINLFYRCWSRSLVPS
ncbi:olfactory receptor 52B2-like [Gopherus flavomarginatus]|uniref:olfactory receptor 52B2-like n=1 Tax=Gopherus flavomarginatus TaxID=286002 RepID=UPI0021CBBAA7|nr:olfactory receptor 52B2-like [Gopherus flavomarginatus]